MRIIRSLSASLLCVIVVAIVGCKAEKTSNVDTTASSASAESTTAASTTTSSTTTGAVSALVASPATVVKPVPMPNPHIPGYNFPEPEPTIIGWTQTNNQKAINLHGWGLWTALTEETTPGGMRVFETWAAPDDLFTASATPSPMAVEQTPRLTHRLKQPRQFEHGGRKLLLASPAATTNPFTIQVLVKYDPTAGDHITKNNLFSASNLTSMLNAGKAAVPDFPNPAISLKPVYYPLTTTPGGGQRYFILPTWPGSPALTFNSAKNMWVSKPFPNSLWKQCVWIDIQAKGKGTGTGVDTTCASNGSSRTPANTYSVDDFIHFQMTAAEAAAAKPPAQAGDYAVLVAMHVTSREITRWTWQTYWWVPNPNNPTAPSSPAIAADRPSQLTGAPRNYAHCTGYDFANPATPLTGGNNNGQSIYCFNPYLEAPFSPPVLPDSIPGNTMNAGKPVKTPNDVGAQTNCMSCHGQANWNPNNVANPPDYTGDRYIDMNSPQFKGTLKVDFLWSIPGNAH
ncbi:MAG: hypothetical protein QOF63_2301 [Thermoanaerobaculia bacterium]|nr:hypothetical protein [Thermoanaerobaculia bacterium]